MCIKVRFTSRALAIQRLDEIKKKAKGKRPIRAYPCATCGGWHLTSEPLPEKTGKSKESKYVKKMKFINKYNELDKTAIEFMKKKQWK